MILLAEHGDALLSINKYLILKCDIILYVKILFTRIICQNIIHDMGVSY